MYQQLGLAEHASNSDAGEEEQGLEMGSEASSMDEDDITDDSSEMEEVSEHGRSKSIVEDYYEQLHHSRWGTRGWT
jgi:hypothetical protein